MGAIDDVASPLTGWAIAGFEATIHGFYATSANRSFNAMLAPGDGKIYGGKEPVGSGKGLAVVPRLVKLILEFIPLH